MSSQVVGAAKSSTPLSKTSTSGEDSKTTKRGNEVVTNKNSTKDPIPNATIEQDSQFFFEDEVYRIDRKGRVKFGLVIETHDFSADEDESYDDMLNKGEVRVAFYPDGREVVQIENTIGLADRTLMPGDVVRHVGAGRKTQSGYCREIHMCADVKILGTKYVIKNVTAERLRMISPWVRDNAVCLGSWVGSLKEVEEKTILKASNGARVEISSNDYGSFKDRHTQHIREVFNPNIFYPGNVVMGRLPSLDSVTQLTPGISIPTNKKGCPIINKYTVESVRVESVWVHWQCKAISDDNNGPVDVQQPNSCVFGDDLKRLKRLNIFESCMLQINDRSYLKYSKCDNVMKRCHWEDEQAKKFKKLFCEHKHEPNQNSVVQSNAAGNSMSSPANTAIAGGGSAGAGTIHLTDSNTSSKNIIAKNKKLSRIFGNKNLQLQNSHESELPKNAESEINSKNEEGWTDDDDFTDEVDLEAEDNLPGCTTSCEATSNQSLRRTPRAVKRRRTKRKFGNIKKSITSGFSKGLEPVDGDELVVETMLVYTTATVVWQDGTIEYGIRSTELYPIHHLDNHEFFPGDFVASNQEESSSSYRDYGVIQTVDHDDRTARVKWFRTYASIEDPKPTYKGESELSVYDLKDHHDFQYRPGTMVIRVANFVGDDVNSTAGQIIDNFPDGFVKVWWVNGHITNCYPQDLFEVGQYDHDLDGNESDDSWETESENSEIGACCTSPSLERVNRNLITGIDSAQAAISRLHDIFRLCPKLQKPEVLNQLLLIYKSCRYLDRLLKTDLFHEKHFKGLIRRLPLVEMRESMMNESQSLFPDLRQDLRSPARINQQNHVDHAIVSLNIGATNATDFAPKVLFNISSTPVKSMSMQSASSCSVVDATNIDVTSATTGMKRKCSLDLSRRDNKRKQQFSEFPSPSTSNATNANTLMNIDEKPTDEGANAANLDIAEGATSTNIEPIDESSQKLLQKYSRDYMEMFFVAKMNIELALDIRDPFRNIVPQLSMSDSGNDTRSSEICDGSTPSCNDSTSDLTADANNSLTKANDNQESASSCSQELTDSGTENGSSAAVESVCEQFCALLKEQLMKCKTRINEYYENADISSGISNGSDKIVADFVDYQYHCEHSEKVMECQDVKPTDNTFGNSTDDQPNASTSTSLAEDEHVTSTIDSFQVLPTAPKSHRYASTNVQPYNRQQFYRAVQREHRLLQSSLPPGVSVISYEDRIDLLSVMIVGPKKTPYESALFFFDIQMGRDYPLSPPACQYISFCTDRLNPNLYEEGKVCVSLLGTWSGRDTEIWSPDSTLLQLIVSIQGLILVDEPYYNEAGYEKQKGSRHGHENSRMYNEMAVIKVVQSTIKQIHKPPFAFRDMVLNHYKQHGIVMYKRLKCWLELSEQLHLDDPEPAFNTFSTQCHAGVLPAFSLVPASRGFCLTLAGLLDGFKRQLDTLSQASSVEVDGANEPSAVNSSPIHPTTATDDGN